MDKKYTHKLKLWFQTQSRDLPWRDQPTPYAVWISEVMLQQTQVAVVIPYFARWMARFPTIQALAHAPIEEVLKAWEGLGYYSRARYLHAGANYVMENFNGELPASAELLSQIKGLGSYTIGAILSFAFHQRMAAVDGNVLRVLTRYYGLTDDIAKSKTVKKIQEMAQNLLPEAESWIISEALIELGATVCTRQPKCGLCPLNTACRANLEGTTQQIPVKSTKSSTTYLYRALTILRHQDLILVGKGIKGKVMADLYEFPYFEVAQAEVTEALVKKHVQTKFKLKAKLYQKMPHVKHSFTRYQALLMPHFFHVETPHPVEGYEWLKISALKKLPFAGGHRAIFADILLK